MCFFLNPKIITGGIGSFFDNKANKISKQIDY